jgi:hypothetical protein
VPTVRAFMSLHFGDGAIQLLHAINLADDDRFGDNFLWSERDVMAGNLCNTYPW